MKGKVEYISKTKNIKVGGEWFEPMGGCIKKINDDLIGKVIQFNTLDGSNRFQNFKIVEEEEEEDGVEEEESEEVDGQPEPKTGLDLAREKGLVQKIKGEEYINHPGLIYIAHELFDIKEIFTEIIEHDRDEMMAVIKAKVAVREKNGDDYNYFYGIGDADQGNVNNEIGKHYIRMAETRAVNRALRLATGIGLTSLEEFEQN